MSPLDKLHDQAMEAAFLADLERRRGNEEQAAKLFDEALDLELKAIAEMTTPIEPTWSILHRSAGWLALDCNQPRKAEQLAAKALAEGPPAEIAEELRDLMEQINLRRHLLEKASSGEAEPVELQGTLRYADATHHKGNRIKIVDAEQNTHMVMVPEVMMNDIVRPMWDLVVTIKGVRRGKSIELREIREVRDDSR